MVHYRYAFQGYDKEHMVKAVSHALPISTKASVEICSALRFRSLSFAKRLLQDVAVLKRAVPYKRFRRDVGHKPGMASGRYPQKASSAILIVLKSAEANAQMKGMHTSHLNVVHICAHRAYRPLRVGGRQSKRTHIEVVLQEKAQEKKKESQKSHGSEKTQTHKQVVKQSGAQ